ncbi:hypothetical protein V1477_002853, partial [Vespula maculifrons]
KEEEEEEEEEDDDDDDDQPKSSRSRGHREFLIDDVFWKVGARVDKGNVRISQRNVFRAFRMDINSERGRSVLAVRPSVPRSPDVIATSSDAATIPDF